jgi:hypothetical protein
MGWYVIRSIMERDFKRTEKGRDAEKEISYLFNGVFEEKTLTLKIYATYCGKVTPSSWRVDIESENPKFLNLLTSFEFRVARDGSCGRNYDSIDELEESIFDILKDYRSDLDVVRAMLG